MVKYVVVPTGELFRQFYAALHYLDFLEVDIMTWGEAALWATGVIDDFECSERCDRIVGDFCHDATSFGLNAEQIDEFGMILQRFCGDLRLLLKNVGLIYNTDALLHALQTPNPLFLHLLTIDERMHMLIETTETGLPSNLESVVQANENTDPHSRN